MSEKQSFYITTPIYYPSANLHIGHSYTTVAADAMARYKRLRGYEVMFLTGTDEHGQKIQDRALEQGKTPKEFVDEIVAGIKVLWDSMDISYDRFIRTTDDYHEKAVAAIFTRLYEQGDIYLSEYEGLYCKDCESFWTETQSPDGLCPDCKRELVKTKEESYFFRLSKYQERLIELIEKNPDFIQPKARAHEMLNNFLKVGLEDLAVSRTSFDWGVKVPFNNKHVIYVWIDALVNYITALHYPQEDGDFSRFWPADVQLVGKEIVRFHTIIWPALLMALDLPLPKQVFGHGWLLFKGGKMSKSMGNVVDPQVLCERYGVDAIRYFLLREVPFGADGAFSNEALVQRINSDLANDLGNLLSRTTAMIQKYFEGVLPCEKEDTEHDAELKSEFLALAQKLENHMEQLQFNTALAELWKAISKANKYIDLTMPWVLAKDDKQKPKLANVLGNLCEVLRITAILLQPYMSRTAKAIFEALEFETNESNMNWEQAKIWGVYKAKASLKPLAPLFPRLDLDKEIDAMNELIKNQNNKVNEETTDKARVQSSNKLSVNASSEQKPNIEFADFQKLELVVAKVLECEKVEAADNLLCSQLDIGNNETRQVVSGIASSYEPEDLVGKTVILVKNLKARKIRGKRSEGMLLCAENGENNFRLLSVDSDTPAGSIVS